MVDWTAGNSAGKSETMRAARSVAPRVESKAACSVFQWAEQRERKRAARWVAWKVGRRAASTVHHWVATWADLMVDLTDEHLVVPTVFRLAALMVLPTAATKAEMLVELLADCWESSLAERWVGTKVAPLAPKKGDS